jgi:hypothetical protein
MGVPEDSMALVYYHDAGWKDAVVDADGVYDGSPYGFVYDGSEPTIGCTVLLHQSDYEKYRIICRVTSSDFVPNKFGTCGTKEEYDVEEGTTKEIKECKCISTGPPKNPEGDEGDEGNEGDEGDEEGDEGKLPKLTPPPPMCMDEEACYTAAGSCSVTQGCNAWARHCDGCRYGKVSDGKCSVTSETCSEKLTGSDVNSAGDGCECPANHDNKDGACVKDCSKALTGSTYSADDDMCKCPDGKVDNGAGACKEHCECDVNAGEVTCYKDDDDGACVPDCDGYLTGSSYSTESSMCVCPEGKTDMGDGACVDDTS